MTAWKRFIGGAVLAGLLCAATFTPGRETYLPYDLGPHRGPLVLDQHGVTLRGDGVMGEDVGIVYPQDESGSTKDGTAVLLKANHLVLRDLVISSPTVNGSWGQQRGTGNGISFDGEDVGEWRVIYGTILEHVSVLYPGNNALRIAPGKKPNGEIGYWVSPSIKDCTFYGALTDGVWVQYMTDADWSRVTSTRHGGWGFVFNDVQTSRFKIAAESVNGGIWVKNGAGLVFESCHVEEFAVDTLLGGLVLDDCHGVVVQGCAFSSWGRKGATSIRLINGTTGCTILPNHHAETSIAVYVDRSSTGNTIYAQPRYNYGGPETWGKLVVDRRKNKVIE